MPHDLLLTNAHIVNEDGITENTDVAIRNGKITDIGHINPNHAKQTIPCKGLHILPGVIDTQVHFREPGAEHKEDLHSGSKAAVMGGVTAVFEMPNTNPPTTNPNALKDKCQRAQGRMFCNFAFYGGATHDNQNHLNTMETMKGCCGIKVFMGASTGDLLVDDEQALTRIIRNLTRRAAFHAEDEKRLNARKHKRINEKPHSHPIWRDEIAALNATETVLKIAKKYNKKVHILHISTAEEMKILPQYQQWASVEATPQHLTLSAEEAYDRLGTRAQMNPPIRNQRHQNALWNALKQKHIHIIGSDHAPHTIEEKNKPYPQSPSGMTGVQTLIPIMLNHVNEKKLSLPHFVALTAANPARLFHIKHKGRIDVGYDADLTCIDLKHTWRITDDWITSKSRWTPYDNKSVTGKARMTIINGIPAMREDAMITEPNGHIIQFK